MPVPSSFVEFCLYALAGFTFGVGFHVAGRVVALIAGGGK